jgi:hypothetical protein
MRRGRLEQPLKRTGIEVRGLTDEIGIVRTQPQRVPGSLGGGEVAVDRPAVALRRQVRRLLGVVAAAAEVTAGFLVRRQLGIGHRKRQ